MSEPDNGLDQRIRADLDRLEVPPATAVAAMDRGRRRRRASRVLAGSAAIVLALAIALPLWNLSGIGQGNAHTTGPRPLPTDDCFAIGDVPSLVVTCREAVVRAWGIASFLDLARSVDPALRSYPVRQGQVVQAWLVSFGGATYSEGTAGCSASGELDRYTVVVSATSGALLAYDLPPDGCAVTRPTASLVSLPEDPCALLTEEQVARATSSRVLSSHVIPDSGLMIPGSPNPCDYRTDGPFASVIVTSVPEGKPAFLAVEEKWLANNTPVSNLGDDAFVTGAEGIYVLVGDGYFSIGMQHGTGSEAVPALRDLAEQVIAGIADGAAENEPPSATASVSSGTGDVLSVDIPDPAGVVAAYGAIWVQSGVGGTLWKLSPAGDVIAKYPGRSSNPRMLYSGVGGGGIQTIAAGYGSIWSLVADQVLRIDPDTGNVTATIPVDRLSSSVATGLGSVWVDSQGAKLQAIDPSTNTVAMTAHLSASPAALAVGEGYVWSLAISEAPRVSQIDPSTGGTVGELQVPERAFLVTSAGTVWTGAHEGEVIAFDAATGKSSQPLTVAPAIMGMTASEGIVWVNAGNLIGIDATSGEVIMSADIAKPTQTLAGIAVLDHRVWLAEPSLDQVVAVTIAR